MARGRSRSSSKKKSSSGKGTSLDVSSEYPGDVKFAIADLSDDQVSRCFN